MIKIIISIDDAGTIRVGEESPTLLSEMNDSPMLGEQSEAAAAMDAGMQTVKSIDEALGIAEMMLSEAIEAGDDEMMDDEAETEDAFNVGMKKSGLGGAVTKKPLPKIGMPSGAEDEQLGGMLMKMKR
jgi:hypothetical protein